MGPVPGADEPLAPGGRANPSGRGALPVREDGGDVLRDPQGGGGPVGVRAGPGGRAHEQRGGTRVAPCGALASHQRRDRQHGREPVRGADADRCRDLPTTGMQRPGLPEHVLSGGLSWASHPLAATGRHDRNRSRVIPPTPPCERLPGTLTDWRSFIFANPPLSRSSITANRGNGNTPWPTMRSPWDGRGIA